MMPSSPLLSLLLRLWHHISARRRSQFGLLLVLMLLASLSEILSIGAVLPFLGVLTSPENVFGHRYAQPFVQAMGIKEPRDLILPLTIIFASMALLSGFSRLILIWVSTRISFAAGADLSIDIYRRTLYQPYAVHVARNSSEVINGITGKTNSIIHGALLPTLSLISSAVMLIMILAALLMVNTWMALAAFGGFGAIYAGVIRITKRRLLVDSQRISRESTNVIKALQEGLGGIRDVLLDGSQPAYCKIYRDADGPLRRAQGNTIFVGQSPRFGMESLGMLLIAFLAYLLAQQPNGIAKAIPLLGALALGAQRLLPVLQLAYSSWVSIQSSHESLKDALDLLDQPLPVYASLSETQPIRFEREITLRNLSFQYSPNSPLVLQSINLRFSKGARIGFMGTTGSGKSTLLDIVMGLLTPTHGALEVDGQTILPSNCRGWQAHIAHVPQAIFLADCTIEENIAFGIERACIDRERVREAARRAQIADFIEAMPQGYETPTGERGVRLSGGQRQRIGIARALYKQADVIIFDEATSALDSETEAAVMRAIDTIGAEVTVLIIAHRLTTLKNCTQVVELERGRIRKSGSYVDVVGGHDV